MTWDLLSFPAKSINPSPCVPVYLWSSLSRQARGTRSSWATGITLKKGHTQIVSQSSTTGWTADRFVLSEDHVPYLRQFQQNHVHRRLRGDHQDPTMHKTHDELAIKQHNMDALIILDRVECLTLSPGSPLQPGAPIRPILPLEEEESKTRASLQNQTSTIWNVHRISFRNTVLIQDGILFPNIYCTMYNVRSYDEDIRLPCVCCVSSEHWLCTWSLLKEIKVLMFHHRGSERRG